MPMSRPVSQNGCVSEFTDRNRAAIFLFQTGSTPRLARQCGRAEKIFWRSRPQARRWKFIHTFREDTHCSVCELMPPLASPLGAEHRFRVFLPPGYHENTLKKYPVLYMHDGHNLFSQGRSVSSATHGGPTKCSGCSIKMNAIEEVIVVGICPNDRMTEYTMPGYEDYGRFLVETLKPLIDAKYRTLIRPDRTQRLWAHRSVASFPFISDGSGRRSSARSPAFRARSLIGTICSSAFRRTKKKTRIYLDSGWPGDNYEATRSMRDRLIWKGYRPGIGAVLPGVSRSETRRERVGHT